MEFQGLLISLPLECVTLDDIQLTISVKEDGRTYLANARKKAIAYAGASGLTTLADDSGLEVDALGGAPGLHSARYLATPGATDAQRRAFLLRNLSDQPRPWRARFRAAIVIAGTQGEIGYAEGECAGEIVPEERGSSGFGYDAIFQVDGTGLTMAQLDLATKNLISHRARAIANGWSLFQSLAAPSRTG